MGGATEVEHPQLVALLDALARLDGDLVGGHLGHSYGDEGHEADARVVGLYQDDAARRGLGDVALGLVGAVGVKPYSGRLRVVGAVYQCRADDGAADGAVPAVIAEGAQERLVQRAADELLVHWVVREHMSQRVWLPLEPERVDPLEIAGNAVGR